MSRHGILVPYYAHTATKPDGTPDIAYRISGRKVMAHRQA